MGFLLQMRFTCDFYKYWLIQVSLLTYIKGVKLLRINNRFTERDVLNMFLSNDKKLIHQLIENGDFKFTVDKNILYSEIVPKVNNYPGKAIFFVGGRNSIDTNWEFSKRLSKFLGITVVSFQYSGYYKSGNEIGLTKESYLESIEEMYNYVSSKYDTYMIGYSLGCFGSYYFNKKSSIFLISPFYSLQKAIRDTIVIEDFNLGSLLEQKHTKTVYVHGFTSDYINPVVDLVGPFKESNVIFELHSGNHVTGLSNVLFDDIKIYLDLATIDV